MWTEFGFLVWLAKFPHLMSTTTTTITTTDPAPMFLTGVTTGTYRNWRHLELRPKLQQRKRWLCSIIGWILQSMLKPMLIWQHAQQGHVMLQV